MYLCIRVNQKTHQQFSTTQMVISFSVINYVVSRGIPARAVKSLFLCRNAIADLPSQSPDSVGIRMADHLKFTDLARI